MKKYEIRAHHGMCLAFFEGKGYSEGFVEHMEQIQVELKENPVICLVNRTDEICSCCPNHENEICITEEKVQRYDRKVLELCGIEDRTELEWKEYEELVEKHIIKERRRKEVCGDCEWNTICAGREAAFKEMRPMK